jgi:hypothetical protein
MHRTQMALHLARPMAALGLPLALLAMTLPTLAQGLPAAPGSYVSLTLTSCRQTLQRGQLGLWDNCAFGTQGASAASGSNVGGILRGATSSDVAGALLLAEVTSTWDDRLTFLGGVMPATAVFRYQLSGFMSAAASGVSSGAGNEVLFRTFVRPFGSWGVASSSNSNTLNPTQLVQTAGPQVSEFLPVLQSFSLPVSLQGVAIGRSLDVSSLLLVRSQAGNARDAQASASANFSDATGLIDLRFLDLQGTDITPQVQWSWDYGTQFAPAVPEPGTWALMALGLAGLVASARRRALSA